MCQRPTPPGPLQARVLLTPSQARGRKSRGLVPFVALAALDPFCPLLSEAGAHHTQVACSRKGSRRVSENPDFHEEYLITMSVHSECIFSHHSPLESCFPLRLGSGSLLLSEGRGLAGTLVRVSLAQALPCVQALWGLCRVLSVLEVHGGPSPPWEWLVCRPPRSVHFCHPH